MTKGSRKEIKMTVENLEKELKEGKLNEIYLLYGEEIYLIDTCIKKIRNLFGELVKGINYIEIDDTNLGQLISDLQTPAFGYPKKLVIVKNTGIFKRELKKKGAAFQELRDKIIDYLKENADILKQDNVLIFVEESVDKGKMLTTLEDIGANICNFEYQKMPNIIARLKAICKAYKVNIDDATLKYFIECIRKQYARPNKRNKKANRICRRKWNNYKRINRLTCNKTNGKCHI